MFSRISMLKRFIPYIITNLDAFFLYSGDPYSWRRSGQRYPIAVALGTLELSGQFFTHLYDLGGHRVLCLNWVNSRYEAIQKYNMYKEKNNNQSHLFQNALINAIRNDSVGRAQFEIV